MPSEISRLIGLDPVEIRDLPLQIQVDWVDSVDPRLKIRYALRNIQVDRLIGLDPVEIRDVPLYIQVDRVDSLDPRLKIGYALRNIQVDRTGSSGDSRPTSLDPG